MRVVVLLAFSAGCVAAQVLTFTRDQMIRYTSKNPFERFEDGRPKVPDALLEQMKDLSAEDVWTVLGSRGFNNQYEGNWRILQPGKKLVGRVVTAQFMPVRPDVNDVITADGKSKGLYGGQNQWVIDTLQPGDVVVVDLFGKVQGGTFVGDNLAFYIFQKTKTGFIVNGAVRDLEGIVPMGVPGYVRGVHPTPISNVMLTGVNIPIRIGDVTVMPGDVVLGDREGVYFIPPHLVEEVVTRARTTKIHDEWTKEKFRTGKYKSSDIYGSPHDPALKQEYKEYLEKQLGAAKK
ncbi:MAG TPA: dimethylmenaquinone methyltransferase [Bryobacteraceae bacterium]|nr:dimethylmenaquinone methyltransferase [Bryobacteraceae bacterium]